MNSDLPSSSQSLGQLVSAHSLAFGKKWGSLFGGLLALFGLAPGIYFGLPAFWASLDSPELQTLLDTTPVFQYMPLGLGAVVAFVGLLALINVWRNWPLTVNVYENGFEYTDRQGTRIVPWENVASLTQRVVRYYQYGIIPAGTTYWIYIQTKDGAYFILDNRSSKTKQLAKVVQERLVAVQLPVYLADLEAGKRIEFGPLALDKAGVYQGNQQLPWSDVEKVEFSSGDLLVIKKGKGRGRRWAQVSVAMVPNAVLFVVIADRYMG